MNILVELKKVREWFERRQWIVETIDDSISEFIGVLLALSLMALFMLMITMLLYSFQEL